jgi:hypothetical protein
LLGSSLRTRASLCIATHRNRPSLASDSESPPSWIVTATVLVCDRFGAGLRPEGRSRYPCRRWPCHRPGSRRGSSPPSGPRLARCGGPCRLEGGQPDRSCGVSTASPPGSLATSWVSTRFVPVSIRAMVSSSAFTSHTESPSTAIVLGSRPTRSRAIALQRLRCPGATTHLLVGSRPSAARLRSARERRPTRSHQVVIVGSSARSSPQDTSAGSAGADRLVAPTEAHGPLLAPAPRRPSDQAGSQCIPWDRTCARRQLGSALTTSAWVAIRACLE